jgi:uncharacterized protein (TIGR02246 family)
VGGRRVTRQAIEELLAAFDRAFALGDAEAVGGLFVEDGQLLLLYAEPMLGRSAIEDHWRRFFARFDTAAWRTEHPIIEVDGDHAHALAVYSETLVPRDVGPSRIVHGRIAFFFRRQDDGRWRISLVMNSHSRPVEEVPPA